MATTKSLSRIIRAGLTTAAFITGMAGAAFAEYPERPITLILPWGAGGGTDATGRILANLLKEELGQPVNIVSQTGGSGVAGYSAIASAKSDGYTIGVITFETGMIHWAGLTDLTYRDFTPIALYNSDPAGVIVAADSPWD